MSKGYFAIGVYQPKFEVNIGTLWRTAGIMGASMLFTIGKRYEFQGSDTVKTDKNIPLVHFNTLEDALNAKQDSVSLVGVELDKRAVSLERFKHPATAWYLMGAEDKGLSESVLSKLDSVVQIPSDKPYSLNVSVAGSIVIYDRYMKGLK